MIGPGDPLVRFDFVAENGNGRYFFFLTTGGGNRDISWVGIEYLKRFRKWAPLPRCLNGEGTAAAACQ
jgi:hypothetical protein